MQQQLISSRISRTCSVALFSDRSPRALYTHTRYASMNIFSNSSSSIVMLHWGVLHYHDPQRRQYLGVSYTGRQVSVQSIVLVYYSYSYPLVSITANRRADSTGCTSYCSIACCFYATYGERHTSKTCRLHRLTALLPLDGQLSRTYTPIAVVQKYLTGTKILLECRCKYTNALHANIVRLKMQNNTANNVHNCRHFDDH